MEQVGRIARTFLVTLGVLLFLCALIRLWRGTGISGVMQVMPMGQDPIPAGISDSLWAIIVTFLLSIALGVALMVSASQVSLRAFGSVLLGLAAAMGVMYAIEVTAFPWNTYEVVWADLIDFWGLFFGGFAGITVFGLAHAWGPKRRAGTTFGLKVVGVVLGFLGSITLLWTVARGFHPFSLEGSWMYTLAFVSLLFSFLAFRHVRRT